MGIPAPGGVDQANQVLGGQFTAAGQSQTILLYGAFNVSIWGTFSGTVQLQRSFDGGTTWIMRTIDATGQPASFTAPTSIIVNEPERGVLYQLACTTYTSGTISYRLSATGAAAMTWAPPS